MGEPGRIQVWWRRLPRAWRVNVTLYLLACVSLFALIVQVLTEEGSQRVEVASEGARRTTTTRVTPTTDSPTTTAAPSSPETTIALPPEAVPTTGPRAPSPDAAGFDPPPPTTIVCRNSTELECGPFFFDPPPGPNAPLSVDVQLASSSPIPGGQRVGFSVMVTDPDHPVTGNCSVAEFGDGYRESLPCSPNPPCPRLRGPWDPPPRQGETRVFSFTHDYLVSEPTEFIATFGFRTDADRCPDAYGSTGGGSVRITVDPPPAGT